LYIVPHCNFANKETTFDTSREKLMITILLLAVAIAVCGADERGGGDNNSGRKVMREPRLFPQLKLARAKLALERNDKISSREGNAKRAQLPKQFRDAVARRRKNRGPTKTAKRRQERVDGDDSFATVRATCVTIIGYDACTHYLQAVCVADHW
jgi:hypothetical protein